MTQNAPPNDLRERVIGWLNEDGVEFQEDQLNERQQRELIFMLHGIRKNTPPVLVYTMNRYTDRIIIQAEFRLNDEQIRRINTEWQAQRRNIVFAQVRNLAIQMNTRPLIMTDANQQITGVRIHQFIIEDELTKNKFINSFVTIQDVLSAVMNFTVLNIGGNVQPQLDTDDTPDFIR